MDSKLSGILDKCRKEAAKGQHDRALKRLEGALKKHPDEPSLFVETAAVFIDAGDSLAAVQTLKRAHAKFPGDRQSVLR